MLSTVIATRPAAKEEIKSLGASFVGVEDEETAAQKGAYASAMSDAFRQKQAELMATTVAKNDIIICTALVMGRKAPVIVTQPMVDAMRPGSVIIDLAADAGGNCAATVPEPRPANSAAFWLGPMTTTHFAEPFASMAAPPVAGAVAVRNCKISNATTSMCR